MADGPGLSAVDAATAGSSTMDLGDGDLSRLTRDWLKRREATSLTMPLTTGQSAVRRRLHGVDDDDEEEEVDSGSNTGDNIHHSHNHHHQNNNRTPPHHRPNKPRSPTPPGSSAKRGCHGHTGHPVLPVRPRNREAEQGDNKNGINNHQQHQQHKIQDQQQHNGHHHHHHHHHHYHHHHYYGNRENEDGQRLNSDGGAGSVDGGGGDGGAGGRSGGSSGAGAGAGETSSCILVPPTSRTTRPEHHDLEDEDEDDEQDDEGREEQELDQDQENTIRNQEPFKQKKPAARRNVSSRFRRGRRISEDNNVNKKGTDQGVPTWLRGVPMGNASTTGRVDRSNDHHDDADDDASDAASSADARPTRRLLLLTTAISENHRTIDNNIPNSNTIINTNTNNNNGDDDNESSNNNTIVIGNNNNNNNNINNNNNDDNNVHSNNDNPSYNENITYVYNGNKTDCNEFVTVGITAETKKKKKHQDKDDTIGKLNIIPCNVKLSTMLERYDGPDHNKKQQQQQTLIGESCAMNESEMGITNNIGGLAAPINMVVVQGGGSGSGGGGGGSGSSGCSSSSGSTGGNGSMAVRHQQGSPFKGQVRTAEDTLVGPCGKKRCADRYDSSESSDSGVAVSCGDCSSSGTSDITEPGSPCSTSSDEGVAIRGASASPLPPSLPKLAPSSQIRPQWPWTPPLAATACSTYKRLRGEPEAGTLPRSGAADPTTRTIGKSNGKANTGHHHNQHHHESQGKITEYFKTQIKPQQPKIKKTTETTMSVLVAKNSTEFRRPPTVQRNKGGLAKYLGTMSPNSRDPTGNDWDMRNLTMSPPPTKKSLPLIVTRTNGKLEKKLLKPVPGLPISNEVLKNIPTCKISSLRLTSEASPNAKNGSPPSSPTVSLATEPVLDFTGCILSKPHVNENNNLTNGCPGIILGSLRSQSIQDPITRLSIPDDDTGKNDLSKSVVRGAPSHEDEEEEEEDSRSSESKPPLSPILSAPTTIRFPARVPEKDRAQAADSGLCRWDKCEAIFESSGGLLEHLQAAHINTQTGGDNFVCHWQGCKVQGRSSCSRRWLERHVLSHGGNKPFRCIVDGCGSRFSSQTALERHVNGHFNQPETSSSSGRRSCENGGKLVRRNGKRLRYRRQPWSARLFDYFDSGVMEGLQHRLQELAKSRTQGRLAETPGNSMALTSQILARRVELDGKTKVLLRWYPQDIEPDEWVLESEVQSTKHVGIQKVAATHPEEVTLALYPAISGGTPPISRVKQRRKPVKNS